MAAATQGVVCFFLVGGFALNRLLKEKYISEGIAAMTNSEKR
jgi:hypothetical protein